MTKIRMQFAGFISFFVRIISLLTGLVFTTIITRNLSTVEYGQWNTINSLLTFGIFPVFLLGFWYTRYTARDINIARIGTLFSLIFSLGGTIIFLVSAKLFIPEFEELMPILLFAVIQVPTSSVITSLISIADGKRPELSSYGFLVFELAKIVIAFIVIFFTKISLLEAIIILVVAEAIHAITLAILIRKELAKKVQFDNIKKILRSLWIPFYSRVSDLIYMADVLVVAFITSSYSVIGLFKVGFVFSTIVGYVAYLTWPLYIKLLGGGKALDFQISTKLTFTFAIPLAVGTLILAKPLLFLLNPVYVASEKTLQILVLYNFSIVINGLYDNLLLGIEKSDLTNGLRLKEQISSGLFKIPTLNIIRVVSYLGGITIFASFYFNSTSMEFFGEMWAMILLLTSIPITFYKSRLAKDKISTSFPWKNITKYSISSVIMGIIIWYVSNYLPYSQRTISFAPEIGGIILLAIAIYFVILLLIDSESRQLARNAFWVIRKK